MLEQEIVEDLEIARPPAVYEIGDQVVYPHHGAGKVLKKEMKEVLGEKRQYLTIKILHNNMTVMVPCENADRAGLRRVIGEDDVKKVLAVLRDDVSQMPKNWNRRFKHNREKIKTGDVFELAEVVRNLAIRETEKGLSTGEKQMYTRAKKILASELMYALDMEEDEAESHLEGLISEAHTSRHPAPAYGLARHLVRRRDHSRRRQRRTPWGRRPQGVRRSVPASPCSNGASRPSAGCASAWWWRCRRGTRSRPTACAAARAARRRCATPSRPRPRPPWRSCTTPRARSSRASWWSAACAGSTAATAAIAAARMTDTVKEDDGAGRVVRTLARDRLWAVQTPQVFRADVLRSALDVSRGAAGRRHRRRLARGGGRG